MSYKKAALIEDPRLPVTVLSGFLGGRENDTAQSHTQQSGRQTCCRYRQ